MANEDSGESSPTIQVENVQKHLFSSSTKLRTAELHTLKRYVNDEHLSSSEIKSIATLLFKLHPRYIDQESRTAARQCLAALISSEHGQDAVAVIIDSITSEASKRTIAPGNAFVLLSWCSALHKETKDNTAFWDKWGGKLVDAEANALDLVLGTGHRESVKKHCRGKIRSAFRALVETGPAGNSIVTGLIKKLTTKGSAPAAKNALVLGLIASACSRTPSTHPVIEQSKPDIYSFYVREILASRTAVPEHVAGGLHHFFRSFSSLDELRTQVVGSIEKGLLRAPEVLLNNVLNQLFASVSPEVDLSTVLKGLVKPLMSNLKSTNLVVKKGVLEAFHALAAKSHDQTALSTVVDELLKPLKQGKVTAADQKAAHCQMLAALQCKDSLALRVATDLTAVAQKESNDVALHAELQTAAAHAVTAFKEGQSFDKVVNDAFTKGCKEKRPAFSKRWALCFGNIVLGSSEDTLGSPGMVAFIKAALNGLVDAYKDITANPIQATQNGSISTAYVTATLSLSTLRTINDNDVSSILQKLAVQKHLYMVEPKPSFLLNPRVYTKLLDEEDIAWCLRCLEAAVDGIASTKDNQDAARPWSQGILYFLSERRSAALSTRSSETIASAFNAHPGFVGQAVIDGIWTWLEQLSKGDKDSVALMSKGGDHAPHAALHAIFPQKTAQLSGLKDVLSENLVRALVISQPNLIPRASWINLCLRTGIDPGNLVSANTDRFLDAVLDGSKSDQDSQWATSVRKAASRAAAELVFVAPDALLGRLLDRTQSLLDPAQLSDIGPTEVGIFNTPEGTPFVDVLSKQGSAPTSHKGSKDRDAEQWEQELRKELAAKKGHAKKLTADEQAKVKTQLAKETVIRRHVAEVRERLLRGAGIVDALVNGPPTDAQRWVVPVIRCLLDLIAGDKGGLLGTEATSTFLDLSKLVTPRLGSLRLFVGVATLRALDVQQVSADLQREPLGELVTRVLYRMRFVGEQRTFDLVSLAYIHPLIMLILEKGGISAPDADAADEQITLAIEFCSGHADPIANAALPRDRMLSALVSTMQRFTQHYKITKDCFADFVRALSLDISKQELTILLKASLVPQTAVRTAVLQAIDAELELDSNQFYPEIWVECHDDLAENREIAETIKEENSIQVPESAAASIIEHLSSPDSQRRRAAARSIASATKKHPNTFNSLLDQLIDIYNANEKLREPERDKFGMTKSKEAKDLWEWRSGAALTLRELAPVFAEVRLVDLVQFLVLKGPLADRNGTVRSQMIEAAAAIINAKGKNKLAELTKLFEAKLDKSDNGSVKEDRVNEAVVILYGTLARHIPSGDARIPKVVARLLGTLGTPSESVQYAVAECLPPLVQASKDSASDYFKKTMDELLNSKKYAARRGAAYGLAGIVQGYGVKAFREQRIMSTFQAASENKKDAGQRQGPFLAYELFSLILGRVFEPYVLHIVPQLLAGFGDANADVREACLDASKTCFSTLSPYGVKKILPELLDGLDESQWRSKKGACELLGAMAYLDPNQLAMSLPEIIPPLTNVLNDSHKEVRAGAKQALQRFGEVINNPEIRGVVDILLKALSDPTKHTETALDSLLKISFVHYLDAPSLALVVRILERGLADRSGTKRKAAQIIATLAHLTERKDLITHLPVLVAGLRVAAVDPVPTTRATASKALGSLVEKLGEDALPDLIPSLMATLRSDTGAGDRLGSAQALSEVLAGLGTSRLEETLPTILQNVASSKPSVREGFMSLFIFLPACFGNSFSNYLGRIIPAILSGLADDLESIRETALRAGRLLVKNFSSRAIDLLLPELERGLADDSHRIRLSSVELVGDLLFNLTGINKNTEEEDIEEQAVDAGASLLEVLGEDRRNRVLSALYICRCDTSGLVRAAAINVWKALVASPRTLRDLVPTLTQFLIRRLASSNPEQKVIAGNALGELMRKAGDGVLTTLLPTLEEGLRSSTDTDTKQGICIALRELVGSAASETLEDHEKTIIAVIRTGLADSDTDVREAAAEAFDSLQRILGRRVIEHVLPHLLSLLRDEESASNALLALLTLLTDNNRSNMILPHLLPPLLVSPMTTFNARALASLAEVAGGPMVRKLPTIINAFMDNIISCKDDELRTELEESLDTVLLSVDEYDGLNTLMSVMLALVKHDDHRKRRCADQRLAAFFSNTDNDFSRYYPDLIRALLISFDDGDPEVVRAAWSALSELTKQLSKEEMETLANSTRQVLTQVGVPGSNLPGFGLPKGINAILPIFLQGLMNGTSDQRTQSALAISDIIDRTSGDSLKSFVTQITGPLIRVVSERSPEVRSAVLFTLNNLLQKIPTFLKPFLPQLQRTFAKSLADTSSETLRMRAARALGTLITMTPRIDPLISELVTGSKTPDIGVKSAMLKALYEVVSKVGKNMNEASRASLLALIDSDAPGSELSIIINHARLLGVLVKVLDPDTAKHVVKTKALTTNFTNFSVLAMNAVLLDSAEAITASMAEEARAVICQGIKDSRADIAENCVIAAGKLMLTESSPRSFEFLKPFFESLAQVIEPGNPPDVRRLSLVVIRTFSREHNDEVRPHLALLAPPIFASVRDMVIPVKLSAEAALLSIFSVVEEEGAVFEKWIAGPGANLPPNVKRSMGDYFKRVAIRLGAQARERKEAEGGQGGLGLSSDEKEDELELWRVGKVDLGENVMFDG
ncbi:ARM repeat-containing protein [Eremomyces bilateralis CBS 781.70]|uniref:eIF-2-alpha kinase activator GCN1 n=1 Tax=Eremomyces bilateralis CBS 781.70 TaxID=1392243 RepID=A0A6G1GE48_9PEZI|nr:ARM repeat-containing protein [Eremomyces bilateralis CBS 781.70]KAF1816139.1 ARM repeat-containing protein [Eremomyces bilateralis CBS 781.70]